MTILLFYFLEEIGKWWKMVKNFFFFFEENGLWRKMGSRFLKENRPTRFRGLMAVQLCMFPVRRVVDRI
jgi:hypothetical protein